MNAAIYEPGPQGVEGRVIGRRIENEQIFEIGSRKERIDQPEVLQECGKTTKFPMSVTYEKYLPKKNFLKTTVKQGSENSLGRAKKTQAEVKGKKLYSEEVAKSRVQPAAKISKNVAAVSKLGCVKAYENPSRAVTKESSRSNLENFHYEERMREAGLKKYERDYVRPRRALSISSSSLSSLDKEKGYETDSLSDLHTDELESDCDCSSCLGGGQDDSDSDCCEGGEVTSSTDSDDDCSARASRAILSRSCGSVVQKVPPVLRPIPSPGANSVGKRSSSRKLRRRNHANHHHQRSKGASSQHAQKKIFAEAVRPVYSERKYPKRKVLKPKERSLGPEGKYVKEVHTVKCNWHFYNREQSPEEVHNKIDRMVSKNVDQYLMRKIVEKDEKLKKAQEKLSFKEKLRSLSKYLRERNRKYLKPKSEAMQHEHEHRHKHKHAKEHVRQLNWGKIPHSKFVDREGMLEENDPDPERKIRIRRKRVREALHYFQKERERQLQNKSVNLDKEEDEKNKKKSKAENNPELNQERAKIAYLKLKEEREAKQHKVKDKKKKLEQLQKTADLKLKKAIKYKFISKEKVQNMTESELHRFEEKNLKANEASFDLDAPKHIYDQNALNNQSDEDEMKKKEKRKKGLKKLEEAMEKNQEEQSRAAAGGAHGLSDFLDVERKLIEGKESGKRKKGKHGHKKSRKLEGGELHAHHGNLLQEQELRVASYTKAEMKMSHEKEARSFQQKLKKKENSMGRKLGKEEMVSGVLAEANLLPFPSSGIRAENLVEQVQEVPPDEKIKSKLREKSRRKEERSLEKSSSSKFKDRKQKSEKVYVESFDLKQNLREEFSRKQQEKLQKRSNKHKLAPEVVIRDDDPSRHLHIVNKNLSKSTDHREKSGFELDPAYHQIDEIRNIENDIIIGKNTIDNFVGAEGRRVLEKDTTSEEENGRFLKQSGIYSGSEFRKNPFKKKSGKQAHQKSWGSSARGLGSAAAQFSEKRLGYVSGKREYNVLKHNKSARSKTVKFKKEEKRSRSPQARARMIDPSGRRKLESLIDQQRKEKSGASRERALQMRAAKKQEGLSDSSSSEDEKLVEERFYKNSYDLDKYDPTMDFIFKMDAKHLMDMPQLFFE